MAANRHTLTQDALTQALRQDGRNQAAKRAMRQKRDGQLGVTHLTSGFGEQEDEIMEEETEQIDEDVNEQDASQEPHTEEPLIEEDVEELLRHLS